MKITYEKYVIRVRHYIERMKECRSINPDENPELIGTMFDFIYWETSHEDFYVSNTDTEIEISDSIWEAIDYSDMNEDEINEIIKDVKNHYKPKKDYRIQLKKVKATI